MVKRTRDSLIYLEEKGEFVSESTPGQVGREDLQEQRKFVGLTSLPVSLSGSVCLSSSRDILASLCSGFLSAFCRAFSLAENICLFVASTSSSVWST